MDGKLESIELDFERSPYFGFDFNVNDYICGIEMQEEVKKAIAQSARSELVYRVRAYFLQHTVREQNITESILLPRPTFFDWLFRRKRLVTLTCKMTVQDCLKNPPPLQLYQKVYRLALFDKVSMDYTDGK